MKIAFLNPTGISGGAEAVLLDIIFSLRKADPELSLELILGLDGPLSRKAADLGVMTHILPLPESILRLGDSGTDAGSISNTVTLVKSVISTIPSAAAYSRKLSALLRRIRPEVVHTNGFKMHILGALARPASATLIWHVHDYVSSRTLMAKLLRRCGSRCDALIANSHSVATDLKQVLGPEIPIHTVYNGIDLNRFNPKGPTIDLDTTSGLTAAAPGTVRVGLVGTLAWWKGHRVFLDAFSRSDVRVPVRGYIVGGPIYKTHRSQHTLEDLRAYAKTLGLDGRIGFTGFMDDVPSALRSLDIVVHASTEPEPFGLVIVEGMASGKAVISSNAGGAAELVDDGINALTHPTGDASILAKRISQLASDPGLRAKLGRAARTSVESKFDRNDLASLLLPIYRQAILSARATSVKRRR